jgi:hypothetical protein
MATISNELSIDVYYFSSVGNAFVRKQTEIIPLPAKFVPCSPGPDNRMKVYSKILYGPGYLLEAYVGQTVSQLNSLITNA